MKTIIIGIAGGTGSGKSTFTRKLKKEFKDDVAVLYHDNYYRDQSDIPLEERRKTNYDHPDAMETELLIQQLMDLKAGKAVDCPVYDYTQHTRSNQVVRVEPKKVILLEGIVEQYLTTVKPMHYLYVEPTRCMADIVINSGKNPVAFTLVKNTIQKILDETE